MKLPKWWKWKINYSFCILLQVIILYGWWSCRLYGFETFTEADWWWESPRPNQSLPQQTNSTKSMFFFVLFLKGKSSSVMCLTCFAQTPTLTNNTKERFCSEDPSDLQNLPSCGDREGSAVNWLSWRCQRFTCGNGLFTFPHLCAYKHLHIWELHTELYAKNMNGSNPSEGKFPVILHVWNSYHIITRFGL